MQRDLFGDIVPSHSDGPKISWSFSKMQSFRDCPRRYYYQYYGSKKRSAKSEPLKKELIELAKMSNRYMVQGHVIHLAISVFLKKLKIGEIWDLSRLISFAEKIVNDILVYNDRLLNGNMIAETAFVIPIIKEIQEKTFEQQRLRSEWLEIIRTCLTNFYTNPHFEHLRHGARSGAAKIEGDTSFSLNEFIDVDGKVDLAFLANQQLIVADWKTGKKEVQDTSLQLLVYVLWAKTLKEWEFDEVTIQKAYLQENELEELSYSELHVNRAKAKIIQDSELLLEMHPFGVQATADAFIQHIGNNCVLCPFHKICHRNN